jgi:hypothetical protein
MTLLRDPNLWLVVSIAGGVSLIWAADRMGRRPSMGAKMLASVLFLAGLFALCLWFLVGMIFWPWVYAR